MLIWTAAVLFGCSTAQAQNISGVFGPEVKEGERAVELRAGWNPETDRFAARVHYQQAIDTNWRPRIVFFGNSRPGEKFDLTAVRGEVVWQLTPDDQPYQTALRFDARVRIDGSDDLALHSAHQFTFANGFRLRGEVIGEVQLGNNATDGVIVQARLQGSTKVSGDVRLGVEQFSNFGSTSDFGAFRDQRHQLGPFARVGLGDGWSLTAGALFGLTESSPDQNLRLFLTKGL